MKELDFIHRNLNNPITLHSQRTGMLSALNEATLIMTLIAPEHDTNQQAADIVAHEKTQNQNQN